MRKLMIIVFTSIAIVVWSGLALAEFEFNQQADNSLDSFGYYYGITGGLFPTGTPPDGNNGSGGTFRWLSDDPGWGYPPINSWHKDDWFPENAGLALTLMSGATIVYDNNGIEDGSGANLYDYSDSPNYYPLLYRGYCMINNYDWTYATYFKLGSETTFDTIIGYFDPTAGFCPKSPLIGYHMSIWSAFQDLPTTKPSSWMPNVASFTGDVFDSLDTSGVFSFSDTGVDRVFPKDWKWKSDSIWRLVYKLDSPVTLAAGVYFFSHNAVILELPFKGKNLTDWLEECALESSNHGEYLKCTSKILFDAVQAGVISPEEMGTIISCGAQTDISKPEPNAP